jgi:hypothetical protein
LWQTINNNISIKATKNQQQSLHDRQQQQQQISNNTSSKSTTTVLLERQRKSEKQLNLTLYWRRAVTSIRMATIA